MDTKGGRREYTYDGGAGGIYWLHTGADLLSYDFRGKTSDYQCSGRNDLCSLGHDHSVLSYGPYELLPGRD